MNTSDLIRELCRKKGISISELARRLGQTPQNFTKKLQRETVSTDELIRIGNELGIKFEQSFTLENGGENIGLEQVLNSGQYIRVFYNWLKIPGQNYADEVIRSANYGCNILYRDSYG